jgi:probable phosphoglycerate mutase
MTTILLIRHGQNEYVKSGRLAGRLPEIHLNEIGRKQSQNLAEILASIRLQAVYSSPLERTFETALPIAQKQGISVETREGLAETIYGRWEGQKLQTLQKRKLWPMIQSSPSLVRFPDGESFAETQARIVLELDQLREKHRAKKSVIACVSHADPIKLAVAHYIGIPLDLFQRLVVEPASINVLAFSDHGTRLVRLNDTSANRNLNLE